MTDTIPDVLSEISVPVAATTFVVLSQARWGEYFGDPGNVVSFTATLFTVAFAVVRIDYYIARRKALKNGKDPDQ